MKTKQLLGGIAAITLAMLPLAAHAEQTVNITTKRLNATQFVISSSTKDGTSWTAPIRIIGTVPGVEEIYTLKSATFADGAKSMIVQYGQSKIVQIESSSKKVQLTIGDTITASVFAKTIKPAIFEHEHTFIYPFHSVQLASSNKVVTEMRTAGIYDAVKHSPYRLWLKNVKFVSIQSKNETELIMTYRNTPAQFKTIKTTVPKILKQIIKPNMDVYQKEFAIVTWIQRKVKYDDTKNGVKDTDYTALTEGKAQCTGYTLLAYDMLHVAGIPSLIVTGAGATTDGAHAWNEVELNGKWYMLDTTWGATLPINYDYLNLTSAQLAKTHTWNHAGLPVANTNFVTMLEHSHSKQDLAILKAIVK